MKTSKIQLYTVVLLCMALLFQMPASACTIFTQHDQDVVLVGNNEDWQYSYPSMYWVDSGENDDYARICFGNSTYVQGGMNEKGLFYDGAACPSTSIPYDPAKPQLGMNAGEIVLTKCATVQEAVAFLGDHNISASLGDHLLFADASGDAVVVEWVNGEMRLVPAESNRLVATNFYLSAPELGWYPCDRYAMAESILGGSRSLNVLAFSNLLRSTAQDWGDGGTKYSNVYDLKNLTVYTYAKGDFTQVAIINLPDVLDQLDHGEKAMDDIHSLNYENTSSLLGDEVVDFRETAPKTENESASFVLEHNSPDGTTVYFTKDVSSEGLMRVYQALGAEPAGRIAVKLATGEPPNSNYLKPELIKELVRLLSGTIVESNTKYGGMRGSNEMHLQVAKDHGFLDIAEFDILDSEGEISLPVTGGEVLQENFVGSHFANYDYFVVLSHFKGHEMAGYGGAIKNISIGIASRDGKSWIHNGGKHKFGVGGDPILFRKSMAEAAKSVVDSLGGNILYINVMNRLSIDCDCNGNPQEPDMHDIGILSSFDPVALDQACVDLVAAAPDGASLMNRITTLNGGLTIEHADAIGLGSRTYKLVSIDD